MAIIFVVLQPTLIVSGVCCIVVILDNLDWPHVIGKGDSWHWLAPNTEHECISMW